MAIKTITPEEHKSQIALYAKERPRYVTYAEALRRVLQDACAISIPEAFSQSRAKTISSFAEKVVRKYHKYKDPVHQLTDLCGARVIVQTLEQVRAVREFIEANFDILEDDEKGLALGDDRFGYRDMHYIVRLDPNSASAIGFTKEEIKAIGTRRAEIQVRTWLQHAWADTLHDRIYKNPLKLSTEMKRTGNLLAALMEEGDRNYDTMAHEIDGMLANYTSYATRDEVLKEIEVQQLILSHEPVAAKRPALSLQLGRLLTACGDFEAVAKVLAPHEKVSDANRCEMLQDLGLALCKVHRSRPNSKEYRRGRGLLEEAEALCREAGCPSVPHLRKRAGLHARALSRLAWALEPFRPEWPAARRCYQLAHEHEPHNPYYLADMLGFEIYSGHVEARPSGMRTALREAIKTCRSHAESGIERPRAWFTAGRLGLLLGQPLEALGDYARGIRHCLAGAHCAPPDALACEREWVERLHVGEEAPAEYRWVLDLLDLAERTGVDTDTPGALPPIAIIFSGGAESLDRKTMEAIRPLIDDVLTPFAGIVISGGTTSGVPGCVGKTAAKLRRIKKQFELNGYIPNKLPHDAVKDKGYDRLIPCGEAGFSPDQILKSWKDLLDKEVPPKDVVCIGFGGGPISAVEYRIALALGARVVPACRSGGTADALIEDPLWAGVPNLMPLPLDQGSFHALLRPGDGDLDADTVERLAQGFHARYVKDSAHRLPGPMRPWDMLADTYQQANREQAKYAKLILEACGFTVRPKTNPNTRITFSKQEVELMAELEHGRWNVERIRNGWRYGKPRDDNRKLHDCLVPWEELSEDIKHYDRTAVRQFPVILAAAGLEVSRPPVRGSKKTIGARRRKR